MKYKIWQRNRPLSSSKNPHFQNEARCTTLSCANEFYLQENENDDFHIKGWASTLILKQRPGRTRKWPIIKRHLKVKNTIFQVFDFADCFVEPKRYSTLDSKSIVLKINWLVKTPWQDYIAWNLLAPVTKNGLLVMDIKLTKTAQTYSRFKIQTRYTGFNFSYRLSKLMNSALNQFSCFAKFAVGELQLGRQLLWENTCKTVNL